MRQLLDTEADLHLGRSPLDDVDDDVKQRALGDVVCSVAKKTPFDHCMCFINILSNSMIRPQTNSFFWLATNNIQNRVVSQILGYG